MNYTSSDHKPERPLIELRSEAGVIKGKGWKGLSSQQKQWLIGGVVLLVLLIGGGAYAWWRSAGYSEVTPGDDVTGTLPAADERPVEPVTHSGLSGVSCEHPDRRPIGVMLAGDTINRPLSGAAQADMVWELPALTSNVTRLLGVYQCGEPTEIGSVRSARHDYLFLAEGIDAIVGHWGGSYHALNRIAVGEFQTINALTNPFNAYYRKSNLPAPYNGFTSYERLWNAVQKLGYRTTTDFKGYEFKDDVSASERPSGGRLTIGWPGAFRVYYEYDPVTNRYVRYWAGVKQADPVTGAVVAPSVVAIMRATNELAVGEGGYNEVGIEGTGVLEVYQDGIKITGTWRKNELEKKDPVHFLNEAGEDIVFTRGQVWVMTPSSDIPVTWEPAATSGQ